MREDIRGESLAAGDVRQGQAGAVVVQSQEHGHNAEILAEGDIHRNDGTREGVRHGHDVLQFGRIDLQVLRREDVVILLTIGIELQLESADGSRFADGKRRHGRRADRRILGNESDRELLGAGTIRVPRGQGIIRLGVLRGKDDRPAEDRRFGLAILLDGSLARGVPGVIIIFRRLPHRDDARLGVLFTEIIVHGVRLCMRRIERGDIPYEAFRLGIAGLPIIQVLPLFLGVSRFPLILRVGVIIRPTGRARGVRGLREVDLGEVILLHALHLRSVPIEIGALEFARRDVHVAGL